MGKLYTVYIKINCNKTRNELRRLIKLVNYSTDIVTSRCEIFRMRISTDAVLFNHQVSLEEAVLFKEEKQKNGSRIFSISQVSNEHWVHKPVMAPIRSISYASALIYQALINCRSQTNTGSTRASLKWMPRHYKKKLGSLDHHAKNNNIMFSHFQLPSHFFLFHVKFLFLRYLWKG